MTPDLPKESITDLLGRALSPGGPVALHLKQRLLPVEAIGDDSRIIVYPPTYADVGYNIDTLSDGTRVACIDSVGSQANRMEPIFKAAPDGAESKDAAPDGAESKDAAPDGAQPASLGSLVPQIEIVLNRKVGDGKAKKTVEERLSLFDLAHRAADAVVHAAPTLAPLLEEAFSALREKKDAGVLCRVAPTSLVFGVWDSRGGSGEKRPRLVRSIIRAWDVDPLHAAAQFTSVWKRLDDDDRKELKDEAKKTKTDLSEKGFADAPATFRKVGTGAAKYLKEFRDGMPNPERRVLGGVLVRGQIEREVTVNLVALRGLRGKNKEDTQHVQRYLLGLSLLAASADIDLFLREGCHLRYADAADSWYEVPRRGEPKKVEAELGSAATRDAVLSFTSTEKSHFEPDWPKELVHRFDLKHAKKLLAKRPEEAEPSAPAD